MDFTVQWFEGLIYGLPVLERLTLYGYQMNNVSIRSHSLKSLFFYVVGGIKITLGTPNLVCLDFSCYFNSIISLEAPNLLEASLTLGDYSMKKSKYYELECFLSNLNCLKKISLSVYLEQVPITTFVCQVVLIVTSSIRRLIAMNDAKLLNYIVPLLLWLKLLYVLIFPNVVRKGLVFHCLIWSIWRWGYILNWIELQNCRMLCFGVHLLWRSLK